MFSRLGPSAAPAEHLTSPRLRCPQEKGELIKEKKLEALIEVLSSCFMHSPESVWPSVLKQTVERIEPFAAEVRLAQAAPHPSEVGAPKAHSPTVACAARMPS